MRWGGDMDSIVDDRMESHGDPVTNMAQAAEVWTGLLGRKLNDALTASDVARMMSAFHLVRDATAPETDLNHLRHAVGYVDVRCRISERGEA